MDNKTIEQLISILDDTIEIQDKQQQLFVIDFELFEENDGSVNVACTIEFIDKDGLSHIIEDFDSMFNIETEFEDFYEFIESIIEDYDFYNKKSIRSELVSLFKDISGIINKSQ